MFKEFILKLSSGKALKLSIFLYRRIKTMSGKPEKLLNIHRYLRSC